MVDLDTIVASSLLSHPETSSGDHCSLRISSKTRLRTWGAMRRLPGVRAFRRFDFTTAIRPSYTPLALELRLRSRETVLTDTPMVLAMKLSEHFLWSNTLIVYLCSEVNCLYIDNTKLINLREEDESSSPFLYCLSHPPMLFGGFAPPAARQTSAVFFML